ncbi:MAG: hypothetical protein H0V32_04190, partial [Nocardioidaceae bacterium]|nr:hypothetical protein [Nocardioidaceae bacterium]
FIFFLFTAIGTLQIPALTGFMNDVLAYLPNIIVAIVIFLIAARSPAPSQPGLPR